MSIRIPSGKLDTVIYFDTGGITSVSTNAFSAWVNKNGGTTLEFTTPTFASVSNMPGVYSLIIDSHTTASTGALTEQMALYITAAGVPSQFREIEIYASAPSSADISVIAAGAITNADLATSADVSAIVENAVFQRALTEPTGAPSWAGMNFDVAIEWIAMRNTNRQHQASSSVAIYSSANSQIASASVGFTSTSANQDQWL